jgi:hypothetical protein
MTHHQIQTVASTTVAPSSGFTAFVIGQIRCAKLRAEITVNQCDVAITSLSAGLISPEAAILIVAETGVELASS